MHLIAYALDLGLAVVCNSAPEATCVLCIFQISMSGRLGATISRSKVVCSSQSVAQEQYVSGKFNS